eukprot:130645_1
MAVLLKALLFCSLLKEHHGSNVGLIGYFDGDCPDGWEEYIDLRGRFALGAGYYAAVSEDGRTETSFYSEGDKGGEIKHAITESETKSHFHYEFADSNMNDGTTIRWDDGPWNLGFDYAVRDEARSDVFNNIYGYIMVASTKEANKGKSSSFGADGAHNNMPPYLVLTPCKKTKTDEEGDYDVEIASLKARVELLEKLVAETTDSPNIYTANHIGLILITFILALCTIFVLF